MGFKSASTIVGPPADQLAEAVESVAAGEVQVIGEYDGDSYNLLYISDWMLRNHGGLDSVERDVEALDNYHHLDLLERDFLGGVRWLGAVELFVTFLDHGIVIRVQTSSGGVFVVLDVSASIDDVQIAIQNALLDR